MVRIRNIHAYSIRKFRIGRTVWTLAPSVEYIVREIMQRQLAIPIWLTSFIALA